MPAKIFTDAEIKLDPLIGKCCAVLGYGAQGRAQALNLRDSGINVSIGLPSKSKSRAIARRDGFRLTTTPVAVSQADLIFLALPDTRMAAIYKREIARQLRPKQALLFAHGFAVYYQTIFPPKDVDVIMVAPKGLGPMVRTQFLEGKGVPCAIAVHQDATGHARKLAFAYAKAIGGARAGVFETTFREETEADLLAEQAVSCGGINALVRAGFETLVEAGYQPETAYFECLHELKFLVDLMHRAGISGMRNRISETAKWGDLRVGPKIVDSRVKRNMKAALREIQTGKFAREWQRETRTGKKRYRQLLVEGEKAPIEKVGKRLRALMPWLSEENS
jgi:ketol-acid reductoisomerase